MLATAEDQETWLTGQSQLWHSLLKPFPPSKMHEVQVGPDKLDLMKD